MDLMIPIPSRVSLVFSSWLMIPHIDTPLQTAVVVGNLIMDHFDNSWGSRQVVYLSETLHACCWQQCMSRGSLAGVWRPIWTLSTTSLHLPRLCMARRQKHTAHYI